MTNRNFPAESPRIAVVGLGVAGGAVATALARDGACVTVFEQADRPGPVGTGFLLQPSGRAALEKLGLLDAILADAWGIERFRARHAPGKELTSLAMSAYGVARGVLFTALADAAARAGADILPAVRIADFTESESGVTLFDAEGKSVGEFDLAIATDGARSALRMKLNGDAGPRIGAYGALWTLGDSPAPCAHELLQETRGTTTLFGLLPVGPHRQTFFAGVRATDFENLRAKGFPAFADAVARIFPEAEPIVRPLGDFSRFSFACYGHGTPCRLHTRRVVLIGDAAHPMSPHLGQGANLALLDAAALALALREHGTTPDAFRAYRRERIRHNRFYAGLSRLLAPTFQSDLRALGPARDLALPLMTALPPARRLMEHTLAGRRRGWLVA